MMQSKLDLLLVNSMAPRQRIASDAALENGLAILRTYLEDKGFRTEVIDEQRIASTETGVPYWCVRLLQGLVSLQMTLYRKGWRLLWLLLMLLSWPIQTLSLYYRHRYLEQRAEEISAMIKTNRTRLLGIKVWYGDSFKWSRLLAAKVRAACPETVIIAGGPQVKVYGEHIFAGTDFDIAIMGPGEELLQQLLALSKQTADKAEFLRQFHEQISTSRLVQTGNYRPMPCSGQLPTGRQFIIPRYRPEDLADKLLFHTLVDGLGCTWNQCNFCSHTRQSSAYLPRPVAEIIEEFRTMSRLGISFFRFSSSETPVEHGREIAEAILAEGITVNFSMFIRATKVTPAVYEAYCLLIRAGLRAVFMGGETGHDLINDKVMNKGVTRKEIIDTIHCVKLAAATVGQSCRIGLSLIYPTPVIDGVSLQDVYDADMSLIRETLPDTVIVNPPGVFPATKWMKRAKGLGFTIAPDYISQLMQYEYSLYKPVELWGKLEFSLQGRDTAGLIKETGRLRTEVASMGIPTDISDEYLMMTEAIGYTTKTDLLQFKSISLEDIISGSNRHMREIIARINAKSRQIAAGNNLEDTASAEQAESRRFPA
ncbi:MAG: radical SAM protein [Sporomusaceae bacterium]|nr:radical SAM protein [Sporomusaceae bacterium]